MDDDQRVTLALLFAEAGALEKAREVAWQIRRPDTRREVVSALCLVTP